MDKLAFALFATALALAAKPAQAVMVPCQDGTYVGALILPSACDGHGGFRNENHTTTTEQTVHNGPEKPAVETAPDPDRGSLLQSSEAPELTYDLGSGNSQHGSRAPASSSLGAGGANAGQQVQIHVQGGAASAQ